MNEFQMYFKYPINESVQEGDIVYSTNINSVATGGFHTNQSNPVKLGHIIKIQHYDTNEDNILDTTRITIDLDETVAAPTEPSGSNLGSFILFSKSNIVNQSSVKGYYSELTMKNDSRQKAELFTVGCEVVGSS